MATTGADLKKGYQTPGGLLGKNSVASKIGNALNLHPFNLGKTSSLGAVGQKYASDVEKGKVEGVNTESNQPSGNNNAQSTMQTLENAGKNVGTSGSGSTAVSKNIGKGWEDTSDDIKETGKKLSSTKNIISNLGKVKDQFLKANDIFKQKTDEKIAGNKTLIERNQKDELDDLAGDTRRSMDNTSVMLGVKGASGGSASKAASKALQRAAGKDRASILTTHGDEMSNQKQEEQNAVEQYNLRREQAYKWEKDERERAILDYNEKQKALDRIKSKSSKWKQEDIDAESDKNLNKLFSGLNEISNWAQNYRAQLGAKMTEFGGSADELEQAAVTVDQPAELMTPDFNENIDLTTREEAEDFFDPNNTGKTRVIKGYDAFGNPIYVDEFSEETA